MNANIGVFSEIDELKKVIVHTPGPEIESITPENAHKALYSDILNLSMAKNEHGQLTTVLKMIAQTYEFRDLLTDLCGREEIKKKLLQDIVLIEKNPSLYDRLMGLSAGNLSAALIEGLPLEKSSLTNFLNENRFALTPLNNAFFTRDAAFCLYNSLFISNMATKVRAREARLLEYIFIHHPEFELHNETILPNNIPNNGSFEGGDFIVFNENVLFVGMGKRTSSEGIDFVVDALKKEKREIHIIVQELPDKPESFIHLDMVFTLLDRDLALIYEPLILRSNKYQTFNMHLKGNGNVHIQSVPNLVEAVRLLGYDLKWVACGGLQSLTNQEREQWHSGANSFAWAPGKFFGYSRNVYTAEVLSKEGYEIIPAMDIIKGTINISAYKKCMVTFDGAELARGGGGARCMTLPVKRVLKA
ncbi:MAG: arginine deiminase [Bacteroidetes bacterium]|jgi:arginine deiminase|nr:arginine deiminase [Bacteroidota bacterium]